MSKEEIIKEVGMKAYVLYNEIKKSIDIGIGTIDYYGHEAIQISLRVLGHRTKLREFELLKATRKLVEHNYLIVFRTDRVNIYALGEKR